MDIRKLIFSSCVFLVALLTMISCVESISDSTTSTSTTATPSIEIYTPKTGDSIMVGKTHVYYQAADGNGGQGLSYFELYVNNYLFKKFTVDSDGNLPDITIDLDSTNVFKTISYYVVVYNKQGKNKTSKTQDRIFIKDKLPTAPSNLTASFTNVSTVTLLWDDNSSNEKGFELWRKDIGSSGVIEYRRIKTLLEKTISTTDVVGQFVAYYYKVRAYNGSGYSDFSNEADPYSTTGGPWDLRAESITEPAVQLYWNDFLPFEQGFVIERSPQFPWGSTITLAPNTTEYKDVNVSTNGSYSYRIAFFTTTFKSPYSMAVSVQTFSSKIPAPILSTPITPISSNPYTGGIQLNWNDQTKNGIDGTYIERMEVGSPLGWRFINSGNPVTPASTTIYNDVTGTTNGPVLDHFYIYRIRSYISSGNMTFYTPYAITPTSIQAK